MLKKGELNLKQKKAAEYIVGKDFEGDIEEICQNMEISTDTLFKWLGMKEFIDYLEELTKKVTESKSAVVWKGLMDQCQKGNMTAIKLYFDLREKETAEGGCADENVKIIDDIGENIDG